MAYSSVSVSPSSEGMLLAVVDVRNPETGRMTRGMVGRICYLERGEAMFSGPSTTNGYMKICPV